MVCRSRFESDGLRPTGGVFLLFWRQNWQLLKFCIRCVSWCEGRARIRSASFEVSLQLASCSTSNVINRINWRDLCYRRYLQRFKMEDNLQCYKAVRTNGQTRRLANEHARAHARCRERPRGGATCITIVFFMSTRLGFNFDIIIMWSFTYLRPLKPRLSLLNFQEIYVNFWVLHYLQHYYDHGLL